MILKDLNYLNFKRRKISCKIFSIFVKNATTSRQNTPYTLRIRAEILMRHITENSRIINVPIYIPYCPNVLFGVFGVFLVPWVNTKEFGVYHQREL